MRLEGRTTAVQSFTRDERQADARQSYLRVSVLSAPLSSGFISGISAEAVAIYGILARVLGAPLGASLAFVGVSVLALLALFPLVRYRAGEIRELANNPESGDFTRRR